MDAQRLTVLAAPGVAFVDRDVADRHREAMVHWHRQPLPACAGADAVAILPFVLLVLDHVEQDETVDPVHLVEEAEPREVLRLVDREPHAPSLRSPGRVTKIGLLMSR